jgi:hypothetical protein
VRLLTTQSPETGRRNQCRFLERYEPVLAAHQIQDPMPDLFDRVTAESFKSGGFKVLRFGVGYGTVDGRLHGGWVALFITSGAVNYSVAGHSWRILALGHHCFKKTA